MPDSVMLVNVCSDMLTHHRWMHESICKDGPESHMFFNSTACAHLVDQLPECLDSIQYAYQQQTSPSRVDAMNKCSYPLGGIWDDFPQRDPYDYRTKVGVVQWM
ncbi:hypothetical protein BDP27DRAFT_932190 [Rhodocollybia butyracea]|uniref:Uncharacterized protein n=1 Tax=Rhodocollybia butyracea TaxID=206335 RepID=A0A9P5PPY5_9AGAR|nr:hypothetical protein BDP27DRAFT_932190 [Rhodocollybia butyracea]